MRRESARGHGRFDETISSTLFFIGIYFVRKLRLKFAKF